MEVYYIHLGKKKLLWGTRQPPFFCNNDVIIIMSKAKKHAIYMELFLEKHHRVKDNWKSFPFEQPQGPQVPA